MRRGSVNTVHTKTVILYVYTVQNESETNNS